MFLISLASPPRTPHPAGTLCTCDEPTEPKISTWPPLRLLNKMNGSFSNQKKGHPRRPAGRCRGQLERQGGKVRRSRPKPGTVASKKHRTFPSKSSKLFGKDRLELLEGIAAPALVAAAVLYTKVWVLFLISLRFLIPLAEARVCNTRASKPSKRSKRIWLGPQLTLTDVYPFGGVGRRGCGQLAPRRGRRRGQHGVLN